MDDELLELQRQFEFAQQAKSSIRLSERNVVELVRKLQELQIIDFELLHTVSGKEYITHDELRLEMLAEITKSGRVSLIDLADTIGVDLYYVEMQARQIVADEVGLMLIQGEIISQSYWDSVAEEINERLQECSQIALAELAAQLHVGSELLATVLEPRLGTIVKGRMEGGQLYTPVYVARVNAMVRGATRGITVPTNLSTVWSSLQQLLLEMNGANGVTVEGPFFQSLFNGLVKSGEILGSLRAGVHWTPAVFAHAQKESVDSFFSQNSFISYEVLQKLAVPQPKQYLQSRYPEGILLDTVFVHPSMIEMLDAATEDAIEHSSWIDSLSVLSASFGSQDAFKLLLHCPSVQRALKSSKAVILGESCVFSNAFIKNVFDQLEKEIESFCHSSLAGQGQTGDLCLVGEAKVGIDNLRRGELTEPGNEGGGSKHAVEKGSKKKKGKATGNTKTGAAESGLDNQENLPTKSKKNQRNSKDSGSLQVSDGKSGARKDLDKMKEDNHNVPSEDWIMQKILMLVPEFEEQRDLDDSCTFLTPLVSILRPMLLTSWKERRKSLVMENTEKMKRLLDNLQKKLDEAFLNLQLHEKALDLFEDDQSTSVILHRHLLRTTANSMVDMLLLDLEMHNKLKNGIEVDESQNPDSKSLSSGDRVSLAKSLDGSLSVRALAVVEALEGKRVETFMTALRALAEESGILLKKLDKKLERTLLHSYRKDLTSHVSSETDPVAILPKVVSLLYLQMHNKALQAPGRAISAAVSRLRDKLEDSAYKILMDYHSATVTLLALQAAATEDDDCSADRIMTKKEFLESLMPELKSLALGTNQSGLNKQSKGPGTCFLQESP
ncbi:E3 UFM1-protein ligase 1 homolog isoform X2 [Telopea speciosissima]|uniref:E3 UFM1-protein ligase 1 homolog isoform X2 n=1 Tax=Telopea speciosissima TaxID=54955 RepID=UPI001CC6670F|nr:E3 UFM1-protein ligase 1 homolog isoform X2 [Telopea speciosissima]